MKSLLSCFFLLIAVHSIAQSKDGMAIRQVISDQTAAWNRGDLEVFMKGYWENDSLLFIGKNGITYGWNNALNNYKINYSGTASMGQLSFDIILVKRLLFQYFHVVGKWHLHRNTGGPGWSFYSFV